MRVIDQSADASASLKISIFWCFSYPLKLVSFLRTKQLITPTRSPKEMKMGLEKILSVYSPFPA